MSMYGIRAWSSNRRILHPYIEILVVFTSSVKLGRAPTQPQALQLISLTDVCCPLSFCVCARLLTARVLRRQFSPFFLLTQHPEALKPPDEMTRIHPIDSCVPWRSWDRDDCT